VHLHCSNERDDLLRPYARLNHLEYNLSELLALMDEYGVGRGLLLGSLLGEGKYLDPRKLLRLCEKSGDLLFPVLSVPPTERGVSESIRLAGQNRGYIKAFKIMLGYERTFADDPVFRRLYRYAEAESLPVMFHTGDTATRTGSLRHSHPLTLDPLANEHSELTIVLCHCGNPWMLDAAELVYKHPNVYADISGLAAGGGSYSREFIDSLARRLSEAVYYAGGTDKFLFGTDYPIETYPTAIELVKRMKIQEQDREKLLWKNAQRVFSI
jgi:predicted TIM-barrel fold metal-dependent hydrolase